MVLMFLCLNNKLEFIINYLSHYIHEAGGAAGRNQDPCYAEMPMNQLIMYNNSRVFRLGHYTPSNWDSPDGINHHQKWLRTAKLGSCGTQSSRLTSSCWLTKQT